MNALFKFPNELAFQIFHDLEGADLFALARSCRHLNVIATSLYLSRYHIPNPDVAINLDRRNFHVLPFLRISVQLTSSQHLGLLFTANPYLSEIREVEGLVAKLAFVRSLGLSLSLVDTLYDQETQARFVKAIHGLITSILARSCETLAIGYDPNPGYSHHINEPKVPRTRLSKLSRRFIAPLLKILRKPSAKKDLCDILSLDTFPSSNLRSLRIYSSTFFDQPLLLWIIRLVNASPITCLSLEHSHPRRTIHWDDVLSAINSSTLSEFCIRDGFYEVPFASVAAFFARHQTITSLKCPQLSRDGPNPQKLYLPSLTKLVSSYESFVHLLEDGTAFPSLQNITLHGSLKEYHMPFNSSIVDNALECVRRCPNELELSLKFGQEDEAFIAWLDVDVNDNSRIERSLHRLVCLKLFVAKFSTKTLLVLPKWLALFPALRLLTFLPYRHDMPPQKFARSVIQACPQLKTLTINEETRTAAAWLATGDLRP